jgi:hypothetical protein
MAGPGGNRQTDESIIPVGGQGAEEEIGCRSHPGQNNFPGSPAPAGRQPGAAAIVHNAAIRACVEEARSSA